MNTAPTVSLGGWLREQRVRRGITLEAISDTTKISTRWLRALENDEFDKLPGGIINKGFIRAYCEETGVSTKDALGFYIRAVQYWRDGLSADEQLIFDCRGDHADILANDADAEMKPAKLHPPKLAKFLLLLVPTKNADYLLGDLEERYRTLMVPQYGVRKAQFWYWWHALISVCPLACSALKRMATVAFLWRISS